MKTEVLKCKLCPYEARQLHQHLKAIHGITTKEYREQFGQDVVVQIGFKPRQSKYVDSYLSAKSKEAHLKKQHMLDQITEHWKILVHLNN